MKIYDSALWISDLDEVIAHYPFLSDLEGKSVFITGATGLVLSAVVDILIRYNETHDRAIEIIVAGRSKDRVIARYSDFSQRNYFQFVPYDACRTDNELKIHCDYIIHGASNSSADIIIKEPVETMLSNIMGLKYLFDYAKINDSKRLLYISSSEVYGTKKDNDPFREGEYGYIDLLNVRNSYSIGKRAAETLCVSYADEYGMDAVIVRPGHIYGPTATQKDQHVSSQWAFAAARGDDLVMKSEGSQIRSYCYCIDCATAILIVLLRGESSKAYNISNPSSVISIHQMGEYMAKAGGVRLIYDNPSYHEKKAFNPMMQSSLDSTALLKLGWHGYMDARVGISHTIAILRDIMDEKKP